MDEQARQNKEMEIENLTKNEKNKCIVEFKTRSYFVYRIYRTNKLLFEENMESYGNCDSLKFINNALVDHILLQFHIITDPANFKKDKNLSVFFFLEWPWEQEVKSKLESLGHKLNTFVDFGRDKNPRHKLLAHWDVATILSVQEPLGSFPEGNEIEFFQNLNEFIQTMQKAMGHKDEWNILSDKKADGKDLLSVINTGSKLK